MLDTSCRDDALGILVSQSTTCSRSMVQFLLNKKDCYSPMDNDAFPDGTIFAEVCPVTCDYCGKMKKNKI